MAYLKPEKIVLGKHHLGVHTRITEEAMSDMASRHSDHVLRQAQVNLVPDFAMAHLLISLRTWLLKGPRTEKQTLTISVPKTWVDHLKQTMIERGGFLKFIASKLAEPKWTYETKEVETVVRVCPHNDTYFSEDRKHLDFLVYDSGAPS